MALNRFKCTVCEDEFESFKKAPAHCGEASEKLLSAPQAKFMEPVNKEKGKSQIKDQRKILTERAKTHARENDYHDLIQSNNQIMAKVHGWVREDGGVRKKVDDL